MRRIFYILAVALMISSVSGIYDPNGTQTNCKEGEPCIMTKTAGSSASSSVAVGPNGTEYSSDIQMVNRTSNINLSGTLEQITYKGNKTSWMGYIQAPTPCHVIDQETSEIGPQRYEMDVQTVQENRSQYCVQQTVAIQYNASFEAEAPYDLEIHHNNETVEVLENKPEEEEETNAEPTMRNRFFSWFRGLF